MSTAYIQPYNTTADATAAFTSAQYYDALLSRDARFDGHFFVGVTSTGVYCRPICRVRTPKQINCKFFPNAALAETQGFRPCLKCRPELAPGLSLTDSSHVLADSAARLIEACFLEHMTVAQLAQRIGITDRHLRRIFMTRFGVSPLSYQQTRRLLLTKQLLTQTDWPINRIADAVGFGSQRRLNDAFIQHYKLQPTALRKAASSIQRLGAATNALLIPMRAPFDAVSFFNFLAARAITGVERVDVPSLSLYRSLRIGQRTGTVTATWDAQRHGLAVQMSAELMGETSAILERCRNLFDVRCDPHAVAAVLGSLVTNPGLRVPGAVDGFELAVRAILGQLVSVAAARTLVSRVVAAFGAVLPLQVAQPKSGITHAFVTADVIAQLNVAQIAELGIVRTRAQAMILLAQQIHAGHINLSPGMPVQACMQQLQSIAGIGPWTASYIAMRALAWPDAFLGGDLVVRQSLERLVGVPFNQKQALDYAQRWRPWRAYATMHLWHRSTQSTTTPDH